MGIVLIFLPSAIKDDVVANFIKLGSIVLISPLAFFFGREYQKSGQDEEAFEKIEEDVKDVLKSEKGKLEEEDVKKLEDVIEEAEEAEKPQ